MKYKRTFSLLLSLIVLDVTEARYAYAETTEVSININSTFSVSLPVNITFDNSNTATGLICAKGDISSACNITINPTDKIRLQYTGSNLLGLKRIQF